MNRKVISAAVAVAMTATMGSFALPANAAEVKTPQYQTNIRQMEKLNRGLIAVKTTADTHLQAVLQTTTQREILHLLPIFGATGVKKL